MPREIVVNGRFLSRPITGVERYAREITKLFNGKYRVERTHLNGISGHAWEQFILPSTLSRESILWSPANTGPLAVRNQALTIQDLSAIEHPEWFRASFSLWYRFFLPPLARRVKVIFTPSEYVRQKVQSRFDVPNVIPIPSGVDGQFFHPGAPQAIRHSPKRYILFVGSLEPRKNLTVLIHAWDQIRREFPDVALVIAGAAGRVFRPVKLPRGITNLYFTGHVQTELPGLYANAEVFVLPSLDEGFGLPVLEAMACGTPVIVSNGGALPEVVGNAGLIFDLSQPDTLALAMRACLSDSHLRASLIEKGLDRVRIYSWQRTANLIWKALNEL